jgi:hypothetical protein
MYVHSILKVERSHIRNRGYNMVLIVRPNYCRGVVDIVQSRRAQESEERFWLTRICDRCKLSSFRCDNCTLDSSSIPILRKTTNRSKPDVHESA